MAAQRHGGLPWIEKYRPRTLGDLVSHGEIISILRRMMASGELPHLLFYGPPGTGKTSTILAVARDMMPSSSKKSDGKGDGNGGVGASRMSVLELNASDERGIQVVRSRIKDFVSAKTLWSCGGREQKLVVLDEADALTLPAQMALRRIMEQYSTRTRFCFVANYVHKIIPALQSRCTRFRFAPLPDAQVEKRVLTIAHAESLRLHPEALRALLTLANGDMRQVLNTMQACKMALPTTTTATTTSTLTTTGTTTIAAASIVASAPGSPLSMGAGAKEGGVVTVEQVYSVTGKPVPGDMDALYAVLDAPGFARSVGALTTCVDQGLALVDIVHAMHERVLARQQALQLAQFQLRLQQLALIERRLAIGASPKIQLAALAALFQLSPPTPKPTGK